MPLFRACLPEGGLLYALRSSRNRFNAAWVPPQLLQRTTSHQLQKNQQKKDPRVPAYHQRIANRQIECQQDEQEYERPPDRGDCLQGGARAAEQPAKRLPDSPQAYPDKRMPEYRSRFDAYRQTHGIPDE